MYLRLFASWVGAIATWAALMSCSGVNITTGGGSAPNDVRPTNLPLVQGVFTGQNGKTVTGTAVIFNVSASNYVLRLEGISTPAEGGLQVQLYTSDGQSNFSLRASGGSQNYTFSSTDPNVLFSSVSIFSTPNNLSYGSALLK